MPRELIIVTNEMHHSLDTNEDGTFVERNRTEGHIIQCDGMTAIISSVMKKDGEASEDYWKVGMLLSISFSNLRTIGMLYKVESDTDVWIKDGENAVKIYVELVGEIQLNESGKGIFNGGISEYPHLGAIAHRIRHEDLMAIFENNEESALKIGCLSQSREIDASITIDMMLSRHFAIVGTTGVGKSSSVTLLMRKVLQARPDVRILILDPHNEFASAFPDKSIVISDDSLYLPFWAFKLEEFAEVIFRGREHKPEEVELLREMIATAKAMYKGDDKSSLRRGGGEQAAVTADTPVPYRMVDLVKLLDDQMGKLGTSDQRIHIKSLMARINAIISDHNFRFMFSKSTIDDSLEAVLSKIFRVPANGRPITTFQLNGIPSEVVNAVVSVLCRLAFDLAVWSNSKIKTLVLCEEAHRYIPANKDSGFAPTRQSIARIAKEGRKYGVSLGIITQRPGELDETILSQCNTMIAMRLGNESDQEIMRKAISGASRSFINFLPSLANREAIIFGQGVSTPMRMWFETIPQCELPANHLMEEAGSKEDTVEISIDMASVISSMRGARTSQSGNAKTNDVPLSEKVVGEQIQSIKTQREQPQTIRPQREQPQTLRAQNEHAHKEQALFETVNPLRRPVDPAPQNTAPMERPMRDSGTGSIISRFRKNT